MPQRKGSKHDPGGRVLGIESETPYPVRLIGKTQRAGAALPAECPHCFGPWRLVLPMEAQCFCGLIYYRTIGELVRAPHGNHSATLYEGARA